MIKEDQILHVKNFPRRRPLTFGEFVSGVYDTWGKRRAKGIIKLAFASHIVEFRRTNDFTAS